MGFVNSVENITVLLTSGQTATFSDTTHDYRYNRIIISGNPEATASTITINGTTTTYGGIVGAPDSIIMDMPIWDCTVVSGQAVLVGTKSVRTLFN